MSNRKSTAWVDVPRTPQPAGTALIPATIQAVPFDAETAGMFPSPGSAADETASLQPTQARGRPFVSGQSGNPKGRPRGARNKLTETFLEVVTKDFKDHGAEAVARLRKRDPSTYLRIVAAIIPRSLILKRESEFDYTAMTDEELAELVQQRQRRRAIEAALKSIE